jgi:transcriptional regulator with XRE-family HTH domain
LFHSLGKTLKILRKARGKSQAWVARGAKIRKSQLAEYEAGKELPRSGSLQKILAALNVDSDDFLLTLLALTLVDECTAALHSSERPSELVPVPGEGSLLPSETERIFSGILALVLDLRRRIRDERQSDKPHRLAVGRQDHP